MDDALIDDDALPLTRKSLLPGRGFFVLDEYRPDTDPEELHEELASAGTAVVADPDADGLACVAVIGAVHQHPVLVPAGPHELLDALERVAAVGPEGLELFVCDLVPDDADAIAVVLDALNERDATIRWFDHHQWPSEIRDTVEAAGVDLVVGDGEEECTADVAVRSMDAPVPVHLEELAAVTRDHDLWQKADPRSDDLADYAYWGEPEEYVETVAEHGPDLPEEVMTFLAERREEKRALIDRAVDRAGFADIGPWTVGITYGRCSQNEVADRLREAGADAAVVVKPAGSASLRGSETFERCHEVARLLDGGGHPKAAGCKPDIYEDMMDFAQHWVTEGAIAKRTILDAFERIADEHSSVE